MLQRSGELGHGEGVGRCGCVGDEGVMDWTIPTAVFFGNKFKGVSEEAIKQSDIRCCISMASTVESFNISVAAGILMHYAARDKITRSGTHGDLSLPHADLDDK